MRTAERRVPFAVPIAVLAAVFLSAPLEARAGILREPLPEVLEQAGPDELIPVSIILREQVSEREVRSIALRYTDRADRRRAVVSRLKALARSSQQGVLAALRVEQPAGRVGGRVRPLWIGNVIGVDATKDVIEAIAARPEVAYVNYNPKSDVFLEGERACVELPGADSLPSFAPGGHHLFAPATTTAGPCPAGNEIECGVGQMRAPDVWDQFGATGSGVVVAVIDTGVCWSHPDIANQIWVNPGEDLDADGVVMDPDDMNGVDDDGNGFVDDLIGWDFDQGDNDPDDDNSHGSHVAGTVAGDGTSGTCAGVAPDAEIMVIRVGTSFSDEVDVWNAMQYAADNDADLISMSLGWPHGQNPDRRTWRQNCDNTTAAGTTMIVAAGNEGSGNEPDNVRTPGDVPVVIGIGATDCSDNAAGFSSRGPVTWQGVAPYNDHPYPPGLIKPEVSGPGVSTKSHAFCSGYSNKSGTSMATPHVAGAAALLLEADPNLTRDALNDALATTAVDLGDPGTDNTFGAGRVDAFEAYRQVAGKIRYVSHVVDDSSADHGNADGALDVGETIVLPVTVENRGTDTATGIHGFLSTTTPGITVLDGYTEWPDLGIMASAQSAAPHFSFRVDALCGDTITFRLDVLADQGDPSFNGFTIRVGTIESIVYLDDDFETDQGWTTASTAQSGAWVREDPHAASLGPDATQPEDDTTPAPGSLCWVTGNPAGSPPATDGDVDKGTVTLTSPVIDASNPETLTLELHRWFTRLQPSGTDQSALTISMSSDGGSNWTELESLTGNDNTWTPRVFDVLSFLPATNQMMIRVEAKEQSIPVIPPPPDTVIEALVDDVRLSGTHVVCQSFSPPALQPPNAVGNTVVSPPHGDHVLLTWTAPPADGTHDPATLFRVRRSDQPSGPFVEVGTPTEPRFVDRDAAIDGVTWYYEVIAENSGGQSGE